MGVRACMRACVRVCVMTAVSQHRVLCAAVCVCVCGGGAAVCVRVHACGPRHFSADKGTCVSMQRYLSSWAGSFRAKTPLHEMTSCLGLCSTFPWTT